MSHCLVQNFQNREQHRATDPRMRLNLPSIISLTILALPWLQFCETVPVPTPWPERFHALTYKNLSSDGLQIADQWYDWPRGRNVYIIQKQLSDLLYNVEWNNGTSFYYTLGENGTCDVVHYGIGIPRPDFLDEATYLGTRFTDGFLCNLWEKLDFIWYYEDVQTKKPVRWDFSDGISVHVMTFEVGAVLHDPLIQAPSYCFNQDTYAKG